MSVAPEALPCGPGAAMPGSATCTMHGEDACVIAVGEYNGGGSSNLAAAGLRHPCAAAGGMQPGSCAASACMGEAS